MNVKYAEIANLKFKNSESKGEEEKRFFDRQCQKHMSIRRWVELSGDGSDKEHSETSHTCPKVDWSAQCLHHY